MTDEAKNELICNMTENIVVLRTKLNITQSELASRIGVSRHTLMAIENKQRIMTWGTFLSLLLLFTKNSGTNQLLNVLGIYTDELNRYLKIESGKDIVTKNK